MLYTMMSTLLNVFLYLTLAIIASTHAAMQDPPVQRLYAVLRLSVKLLISPLDEIFVINPPIDGTPNIQMSEMMQRIKPPLELFCCGGC